VYFVDRPNKPQLLAHLVNELPMSRAIVFTRTKHGADKVVRHLHTRGIKAEAIHGNKSQNARERALENFKAGKIPVLIATDIASRGIDVDNVSHVVNYDLTHEPETYVHRIGRTARAGQGGAAISFCDREERGNLRAIEKLIRQTITVCDEQPAYEQRAAKPIEHVRPLHPTGGAASHGGHGSRRSQPPIGRRDQQQRERQAQRSNQPSNGQARPQHAPQRAAAPAASGQPHRDGGHRPGGVASKPHYTGKVKRGGRRRGF
jgi:ATP-dependent RNA helicase RhlE